MGRAIMQKMGGGKGDGKLGKTIPTTRSTDRRLSRIWAKRLKLGRSNKGRVDFFRGVSVITTWNGLYHNARAMLIVMCTFAVIGLKMYWFP